MDFLGRPTKDGRRNRVEGLLRWISRWWYGQGEGFHGALRGVSRSGDWPAVRRKHLRKEPQCQWCGTSWVLEVHHVVPFHVDPTRELDPSNLITLCELPGRSCHFFRGHLRNWRGWNPRVREECRRKDLEDI